MAYDIEQDGKTYRVEGAGSQGEAQQAVSDYANNTYLTDSFTSTIDAQNKAQINNVREAVESNNRFMAELGKAITLEEEADELESKGNLKKAMELYLQAASLYSVPEKADLAQEKAEAIAFKLGDTEKTLKVLKDNGSPLANAKAGYVYFKKGDTKSAFAMFDMAYDLACAFRCEVYAAMGDYQKAADDCYKAYEDYQEKLGVLFKNSGDKAVSGIEGAVSSIGKEQLSQTFEKVLTHAAEQGDKKAYITLGDLFNYITDLKDDTKVVMYYEKAIEQGVKGVYAILGYFYCYKDKSDYKKAREWFEKGIAAEDDPKCIYWMGRFHSRGTGGVPRNKKLANKYIREAARKGSKNAKEWLFDDFLGKLGFSKGCVYCPTGVGKTILFSLIFGGLSTLAANMIITELLVGFPSIQAGFNQWIFLGIAAVVSFFVVFWRHVPLIILLSLLSATGIFGMVHEAAKGTYFPESISSAFLNGGGNAESGQKVKLTPRKVIENATVYAEPSTDSAVVKKLFKGTYINTTGKTADGWSPVEHFGDTGWINAEIVKGRGAKVEIAKGDIVFANRRYIKSDDTSAYVYCLATIVEPSSMSSGFAKVTYYDGEKPTMDELMQVNFMQNYLNTHYAEGNPLLRMSGRLEILNFNETSAQVQYEDGRTATLPLSNIVFTKTKPK